ncbi:MAG: YbjQ family protein [Acidimicrobiia bacterium]|nr:YbjQ family protein [Acidimicrobiia bacterium]
MPDLQEELPLPVSTTNDIPGRVTGRFLGPVFGLIVRSSGAETSLIGQFKGIKKGEVKDFTLALEKARRVAADRLGEHAQALGADAVVGLRFDSTETAGQDQGMAEIMAYGTAITLD